MEAIYIDHMGDDLRVVNAARVSFSKESNWSDDPMVITVGHDEHGSYYEDTLDPRDAKLIHYLASNGHWTPFAHPQITLRERVPVFVARQRFKHTVGFTYNEVSRRYVSDEPEFYVPEVWRAKPEGSIKQGSGDLTVEKIFIKDYAEGYETEVGNVYALYLESSEILYKAMIDGGVAPEMARMILPQSMYTEYYVTGSLAAWARAYKQRSDPHAQEEIQTLANEWDHVIRPLFPQSWSALVD